MSNNEKLELIKLKTKIQAQMYGYELNEIENFFETDPQKNVLENYDDILDLYLRLDYETPLH